MNKRFFCFLVSTVLSIGLIRQAAGQNLTVTIRDQSDVLLPGATVYLIRFSNTGPDAAASTQAVTASNGQVMFSGLSAGPFELAAEKHGYGPSLRDQLFSPEHIHLDVAAGVDPAAQAIRLSSAGISGRGTVTATIAGASATALLFGGVRATNATGNNEINFGVCKTAGGACSLVASNIPAPAAAGTYNFDVFDPTANTGANVPINSALAADGNVNVTVDFAQQGLPPETVESNVAAQSANGSASVVSVDGVVTDTTSARTSIPFAHVSFEYTISNCSSCTVFSNSDNNGRFKLYNLVAGTTYYARIFGSCNQTSCFEGHVSTKTGFGAPPGINDFLYTGDKIIKRIELNKFPPGTGRIPVYVRNQFSQPIAYASVSLWPDWDGWETDGDANCTGPIFSEPGMANANKQATTGYVLLDGLLSGNYSVNVWTQFSNNNIHFNAGPDGQYSWGPNHCNADDLRVHVSTTTGLMRVYDGKGVDLNLSSVTVVVPTQSNNSGLVRGQLRFPGVVDILNDPVTLILRGDCQSGGSCSPGNFVVVLASGSATYDYSINVSSGSEYSLRVESGFWGRVSHGGEYKISLKSTGTVVVDMDFLPAGKLRGKLFKPDGSVFLPTHTGSFVGASISLRGRDVQGYSYSQVTDSGEYLVGGLLPGEYEVQVHGWGNFSFASPRPLPTIQILANRETVFDATTVDAVDVKISISTPSLPAFAFINSSENRPFETWTVQALPPGAVFESERILSILDGSEDFKYYPAGAFGCGQSNWPGGFCLRRVPAPSTQDLYLMRRGDFMSQEANSTRPFFTIFNSSRNVVFNALLANTVMFIEGSTHTVEIVDVTPSPAVQGQATLDGTVIASNILREQDFIDLGGSFNNFMKFIPIVSLYDSSGTLHAAGMVVPTPPMSQAANDALEQSIASGNFTLFMQTLNSLGNFGYEIRGLRPSETYLAVIRTPNYPPYQTRVTLGVDASTTTLNFNLDTQAGTGAALSGVVTTTGSIVLPNAAVTVEAQNYPRKTLTTSSSGAYSIAGLPIGAYKVSAQRAGYVPASAAVNISGTGSVTQNFSLSIGSGVITGTVYSQKIPFAKVKPGAIIYAYDDTYNGANPDRDLPLYKVKTSSSGEYRLENLVVGNTYKLFLKVPGKYVLSQSTVASASGVDFLMLPKPMRVEVTCRPETAAIECTVANADDFSDGNAWYHDSSVAFSVGVSTPITDTVQLPDKTLVLRIPLASLNANTIYNLHIEATSVAGQKVTQDTFISAGHKGGGKQDIDDNLIGDTEKDSAGRPGNQASLDDSGKNQSSVTIPPGAMLPVSSAAIPAVSFSNIDVNASTVAAVVNTVGKAAFVSELYKLNVSSINLTQRGFDLCLAYDKTQADIADAAVHHYNPTKNKWEIITGQQTLDAVKGVVCAKVYGLSSVTSAAPSMRALFDGHGHHINPLSHESGHVEEGSFGILRPSVTGNLYSGDSFKVFNFPNPFNLQSKVKNIAHGGATTSITTTGTIIKYEVPSSAGTGSVSIRIYNLAGELVRELDQGEQSGGRYYYTTWDGRNKDGQQVANGVYYGVVSMPGVKAKNATFKMAVIK